MCGKAASTVRRYSARSVETSSTAVFIPAALIAGNYPLRSVVINLVHPVPTPLAAPLPADVPPGPLADQIELYHDLVALAAEELREMTTLRVLAGDVPVTEVPLLDDVNDLDGLARLATILSGGPAGNGSGRAPRSPARR